MLKGTYQLSYAHRNTWSAIATVRTKICTFLCYEEYDGEHNLQSMHVGGGKMVTDTWPSPCWSYGKAPYDEYPKDIFGVFIPTNASDEHINDDYTNS